VICHIDKLLRKRRKQKKGAEASVAIVDVQGKNIATDASAPFFCFLLFLSNLSI